MKPWPLLEKQHGPARLWSWVKDWIASEAESNPDESMSLTDFLWMRAGYSEDDEEEAKMKTTHELSFTRRCPVHNGLDHYELIVETTAEEIVKVEEILAAVERLGPKLYQEELTSALAAELPGCTITTRGIHSGVKTTCSASSST
jgi:hypothetical protein